MNKKYDILIWDMSDTLDVELLDSVLKKFKRPSVHSVDTGSDDYGLVIKERNDRRSAQSLYEAEVEEMNKS